MGSKSGHFMFRKPTADPGLNMNVLGNCSLLREVERHIFCQRDFKLNDGSLKLLRGLE